MNEKGLMRLLLVFGFSAIMEIYFLVRFIFAHKKNLKEDSGKYLALLLVNTFGIGFGILMVLAGLSI